MLYRRRFRLAAEHVLRCSGCEVHSLGDIMPMSSPAGDVVQHRSLIMRQGEERRCRRNLRRCSRSSRAPTVRRR